MDDFTSFCIREFRNLTIKRARLLTPDQLEVYCEWIARRANGDEQKVTGLINHLNLNEEELPYLVKLRKIWIQLYNAGDISCSECGDIRYLITTNKDGISGASPCHSCFPSPIKLLADGDNRKNKGGFRMDDFNSFCSIQFRRLTIKRAATLTPAQSKVYEEFIASRASGDELKVRRLINHLNLNKEELPYLVDLREIWIQLYPADRDVRCSECGGKGYLIIENDGISGASRCPSCFPLPIKLLADGNNRNNRAGRRDRASGPSLFDDPEN